MPQYKNAELEANLRADYLNRDEFHQNGARLADMLSWMNRDGGGVLVWGFSGQSSQNYGEGYTTAWTPNNIVYTDYSARAHGGPLCTFDAGAANEFFNITDDPWQETGTASFFVACWCLMGTIQAADMTLFAKYDDNVGNECSWWLGYDVSAESFMFSCVSTGNPNDDVFVTSTAVIEEGEAYLVAGFFNPSTLMSIGVGGASASIMTYTTQETDVPASLFDTDADLTIGATDVQDKWWDGGIGVGLGRANVPGTSIRSYMTRLYAAGRWLYSE